jgi:hypothetical protein
MNPNTEKISDFRFLVEPLTDGAERRRDAAELLDLQIGAGVCALDVDSVAGVPRLEASRRDRLPSPRALQLEAVSVERGPALLVITPPEVEVRVNGGPAPRVAVLEVGDQVQLEETLLHVTRFRHFEVGPPSTELVGRKCGVCLMTIDEHTQVYVHDCGQVLHLEPESKPAEERLECALMGCPTCDGPVSLESGFTYLPDL